MMFVVSGQLILSTISISQILMVVPSDFFVFEILQKSLQTGHLKSILKKSFLGIERIES